MQADGCGTILLRMKYEILNSYAFFPFFDVFVYSNSAVFCVHAVHSRNVRISFVPLGNEN